MSEPFKRSTVVVLLGSLAVSIGCSKAQPATPVAAGQPALPKPMPAVIPFVLARVNGEASDSRTSHGSCRRIPAARRTEATLVFSRKGK